MMARVPRSTARCLSLATVGVFLALAGCRGDEARARAPSSAPTADAEPAPARPGVPEKASAAEAHHPPIDCPLAKAGIDPHKLRPFEDVEAYIAFLDREDRAAWQRPDAVVEALGLSGTETVADLGAGSGYFTFRLAKAVPQGTVVAIDIEPEMIRHIHHRAMTEGVNNVEVVIAQPDDPRVPEGVDLVFVCDVLHHVQDRPAWLSRLAAEVRSGTRLVFVEFREGALPQGPPESVKIPKTEIIALVTGAGFTLESERADLLPYQHFLVFRRL
jgi:SAM-dependent methyltransferase